LTNSSPALAARVAFGALITEATTVFELNRGSATLPIYRRGNL